MNRAALRQISGAPSSETHFLTPSGSPPREFLPGSCAQEPCRPATCSPRPDWACGLRHGLDWLGGRLAAAPLYTPVKESPMPARLLSIPVVAAALDVDRRTIYRFIAAGDLPVVDLRTGTGRSRIRVPAAGLDEFISSRAVAAPRPRR